jgi:pyridoxamine 5'-phosphate oxidase
VTSAAFASKFGSDSAGRGEIRISTQKPPDAHRMDFDRPPSDPLEEFNRWFAKATATAELPNPNAMTLATVDAAGRPSARIVLLKGIDERGAVFYTNLTGRKAIELEAKQRAALVLYWDWLGRQVRIEGTVSRVSDAEADAYFATRPRESQIGAWASKQSQHVANRAELDAAVRAIEERFPLPGPVPRPPFWGGYRVALERMEFWQAHPFRLHDRIVYSRSDDGAWQAQRLYP